MIDGIKDYGTHGYIMLAGVLCEVWVCDDWIVINRGGVETLELAEDYAGLRFEWEEN